jgi:hypothetical protein
VSTTITELLARGKRLEDRRVAAVALILLEVAGSDQLARKSLEEVLFVAEAAREEARRSYSFEKRERKLRLRLRERASP